MDLKSAFGTQADKIDTRIDRGIATAVLGLAALMFANLNGGAATSDYTFTSNHITNASVTAQMNPTHSIAP